jgi:hypothetical protein
MDAIVTLQDVANIVSFVAPGYFAIQVYGIFYAKKQRDFSQLLIESVIYSLPIVTFSNFIWQKVFSQPPVTALHVTYAVFLIVSSLLIGGVVTFLRVKWPVKNLAKMLGFGSPNEDFVKVQFLRLKPEAAAVTVKLKSGATFSGTPDRTSRYSHGGLKYYYFTNMAWFSAKKDKWQEQAGGVLLESSEIEYIITPELKDD